MTPPHPPSGRAGRPRRQRRGLIGGTMLHLARAWTRSETAERLARAHGLLQCLDPRVKVVGLLALVVTSALAANLPVLLGLLAIGAGLASLSGVRVLGLARRLWLRLSLFTGPLALPAVFLTPGDIVYRLPILDWPMTLQGLRSAAYLVLRAEAATTFSLLLVLCTPWARVLKALRVLRVPAVLVVLLAMTQRYIFLLLQVARDMCEARQSRTVGTLTTADQRRWAVASIGVLLEKTFELSSEIHLAMQARGFRGEVDTLDDFRTQPRDWVMLTVFLGMAVAAAWLGAP
ncbi:MAG TPA: cobalt ECF transporter T component CbiQ [Gemmataceae bacterium]|jgi:cobalt/nickel transport system permease protein|nr:cobalt ECF transporter T component CbiQ [Gemmataceae bacterium]